MGSEKRKSLHDPGPERCHQWAHSTHSFLNFFQRINLATKVFIWTLIPTLNWPCSIEMAKDRLLDHLRSPENLKKRTLLVQINKRKSKIAMHSNWLDEMDRWRWRGIGREGHFWIRLWRNGKFYWWGGKWISWLNDTVDHNLNLVLPGNMFYFVYSRLILELRQALIDGFLSAGLW